MVAIKENQKSNPVMAADDRSLFQQWTSVRYVSDDVNHNLILKIQQQQQQNEINFFYKENL